MMNNACTEACVGTPHTEGWQCIAHGRSRFEWFFPPYHCRLTLAVGEDTVRIVDAIAGRAGALAACAAAVAAALAATGGAHLQAVHTCDRKDSIRYLHTMQSGS